MMIGLNSVKVLGNHDMELVVKKAICTFEKEVGKKANGIYIYTKEAKDIKQFKMYEVKEASDAFYSMSMEEPFREFISIGVNYDGYLSRDLITTGTLYGHC